MDRRKTLKAIALGGLATGALIEGCKLSDKHEETAKADAKAPEFNFDRAKEEKERDTALLSQHFFDAHEMATIALLCDIIIPKDEVSGSATEAGVPAFIDFIALDMPSHQTPLRGGLRWLDLQCLKRFDKNFKECNQTQRMEVIDDIAWPQRESAKLHQQGVAFFSLMRDLTATGFYTSEMGVKDLGYAGNVPNKWNGIPDEELKRLKLSYSEWELKNCASYE